MFTLQILRNKGLKAILAIGVLATANFSSVCQAGLFDFKSSSTTKSTKPKPASASKTTSKQVTQAQYTEPAVHQGETVVIGQPCIDGDSAPAMKFGNEKTFDCFNCGSEDKCQTCSRHHAKKCGSTWYPRVAPYCASGWGYTQPCWRRTQDTYNCPKPTLPAPAVPLQLPEPLKNEPSLEPSLEPNPLPEVPPLPRESASRR